MIDRTGPKTSSRAIRISGLDVGEDGRLDELPARQIGRRRGTAAQEQRAPSALAISM